MPDNQLETIRRYCDTSGYRLNGYEKSILCNVIENPSRYNGFESRLYQESNSGRDYRDTWDSLTDQATTASFEINADATDLAERGGFFEPVHCDLCSKITDVRFWHNNKI